MQKKPTKKKFKKIYIKIKKNIKKKNNNFNNVSYKNSVVSHKSYKKNKFSSLSIYDKRIFNTEIYDTKIYDTYFDRERYYIQRRDIGIFDIEIRDTDFYTEKFYAHMYDGKRCGKQKFDTQRYERQRYDTKIIKVDPIELAEIRNLDIYMRTLSYSQYAILVLFKILYHKFIFLDIPTIFSLVQTLLYECLEPKEGLISSFCTKFQEYNINQKLICTYIEALESFRENNWDFTNTLLRLRDEKFDEFMLKGAKIIEEKRKYW
jgi:hypothetical protein